MGWKVDKQCIADPVDKLLDISNKLREAEYYAECPQWMMAPGVVNEARLNVVRYKKLLEQITKEIDETSC